MTKPVADNLPYKIIPLAEAFPDYPGGAEAFLPDHGDFVSKPKDAFVILVQDDFISDMAGAFSHEDLLGTLTYPSNDAIFSAILFKKDLHIPNAVYLDYNTDYSPALIVEGNLTAKTLNLAGGQTHIKGDCTLSEVLYGHYNHGSLIVDGTTTAPLIIASDYSMTFNGKVHAEHVIRDGSAFKMNEPTFNISALGFKLKFKLPKLARKILDFDADRAQITKILDPLFLTYASFDDENINTALNKGESLYVSAKTPRKPDAYMSDQVLEKIKAYETAHAKGEAILRVDLTGCYLKQVPEELSTYTALNTLILWNNSIETLPAWLPTLSALRHLNLSCNSGLSELSLSPQQMAQLETLNIADTLITSLDSQHAALPSLIEFSFGKKLYEENQLIGRYGLDFDWSRTPNLQHLHIDAIGWWWPWNDDFGFYQCQKLSYLQLGYVVNGDMGEHLCKLQNLEFYGFVTGFQSDGDYEGIINVKSLKRLPKLQVLNMEQNGKMVNMDNIRAIRAALPQVYVCAPNLYNNLSLINVDSQHSAEMSDIYAQVGLTRDDDKIKADVPEDLAIQLKYKAWLSSYGSHKPTLETVLAAFDEALNNRLSISPHLFEEVMTSSLKFVRNSIYDIEDRSLRQPLFVVLNSLVEKLMPIMPKPASWTHLLPFTTYQIWELVFVSKIWYLLRRADRSPQHLAEAIVLLAICLPIEAKKNGSEFKELGEVLLEIQSEMNA